MMKCMQFNIDIIAFSESKLQKGINPVVNINIPNYSYEHTPTEAAKGGTLIYISNQIDYKPRPDLNIYVSKTIESTFIELIYPKSKNKIIGCIYKHHNIPENEFVEYLTGNITVGISDHIPQFTLIPETNYKQKSDNEWQ